MKQKQIAIIIILGCIWILSMCLVSAAAFFIGYQLQSNQNIPQGTGLPRDFQISIDRGACFGVCPDFLLTVYSDGTVTYVPRGRNAGQPAKTFTIDNSKVLQIYNAVSQINFFNYNDRYENNRVTDLPSLQISVTMNGKTKTIYMYGLSSDIPQELPALASQVESITGINSSSKPSLPNL